MDERALNVEIERATRSLQEQWESPELLSRIQSDVASERLAPEDGSTAPVFREEDDAEYRATKVVEFRRKPLRILAIAASLALVMALGAIVAGIIRGRSGAGGDYDRWVLEEAALHDVEQSEKAHLAAIERLETIAGPTLEKSSEPLALSYREKLMLLDDAIAECEQQIEINRKNTELRKQLLAMYSEKQATLQQLMRENLNEQ